jgi:hypothetical protein
LRQVKSDTRGRDAALVGLALGGALVMLAQLLDFGFGRDQGIYAAVARAIREGGVPYRDAWDFKPPGIYFLYALAGNGASGIRWLEAAALLSLVAAFAKLSRHYLDDSRPGILGAALAILIYVQLEFWHTGQPESFGAPLVAWGAVFATETDGQPVRSPSRQFLFRVLSGVCYGFATLLKPMIGAAGVASVAAALVHARRRGAPSRTLMVSHVAPFAAGAALPIAACVGFFLVRGGITELSDALFVFVPDYVSLAWRQASVVGLFLRLLRGWLFDFSAVSVVGLALLLMPPFPAGRERDGVMHIGAIVAVLLAGIFMQARLFPYHFGTVLPLTALLAGWGIWRLWLRIHTRWPGVIAFAILAVLLIAWRSATTDVPDTFAERSRLRMVSWTHPSERQSIRDRLYSVADYRAADNRLVADWLTRETPAAATVFVYGFTPEIYVAAGRRPASRYIYDVPQRAIWSRDEARAELMAELNVSRPIVVVVEHGDTIPWVTGAAADSAADLETFSALRQFLDFQYGRTASIGKFDVYRHAR